ncbi:Asp-tRNA(Asn)/Glu-tRNA(Gln) amidotransferase A subunit family amidase [Breoghania corrubedonensis]|uniref:Asp-tRNA(Asn)/Glu-tRNA(Gln) amidotransferase A subunit family amidase n=1 Tax=Breoghania corrubedonensis TaxID=665038 RepID=A0A2T5VI92_9HYPH|nr:amidase [Breoghania corrubedonensis]PTW63436.1 Asp-tRNA(Asn)/Glu-tRNA(Gln) amidotransferase A subunit family amidase [Breoghania corrubedonensis]
MTGAVERPLGALETRTAIAEGRLSAEAATEALIERIAALEPETEAWVAVDADGARAGARVLDRGPERGALHGVAIGVKDIFAANGLPWRCGSPIWANRIATFDAASVAMARAAGAIVLGKTETTEFASYKPCRTRNPAAPGRTPGGSSSGSAAAVMSGMVPLAFGTQTSGSIIRPASFCGVVGYKPSFDLIAGSGVAPLARSFDTVGLFARSVADIAFAAGALTGLDLAPENAATPPCPVGLFRSAAWEFAEPDLMAVWETFEADMSASPAILSQPVPAHFADELEGALDLHARIMAVETAEALAHEAAIAPELLSEGLVREIAAGRALSSARRHTDRLSLHRLRARALDCLDRQAVWLTPSACGAAPDWNSGTGNPAFNRTWSLLGLPACSVPLLADPAGRPIGVQVVGAMGNDAGVLAVADWLRRHFT